MEQRKPNLFVLNIIWDIFSFIYVYLICFYIYYRHLIILILRRSHIDFNQLQFLYL